MVSRKHIELREMVIKSIEKPEHRVLIYYSKKTAPTYIEYRDKINNILKDYSIKNEVQYSHSERIFMFINGSTIRIFNGEIDKIRGIKIDKAFLHESDTIDFNIIDLLKCRFKTFPEEKTITDKNGNKHTVLFCKK